jgi:protein involved in polysaccharide export with SLBB domain
MLVLFFSVSVPGHAQIRVGDTLHIIMKGVPLGENARIEGKYVVGQAGTIRPPVLDMNLAAAGKSGQQLARSIEKAYRKAELYNSLTIKVITNNVAPQAAPMVSVGGEVRRPGPVLFQPGMTIVQLIQAAGDITIFGTKKRVYVTRGRH